MDQNDFKIDKGSYFIMTLNLKKHKQSPASFAMLKQKLNRFKMKHVGLYLVILSLIRFIFQIFTADGMSAKINMEIYPI